MQIRRLILAYSPLLVVGALYAGCTVSEPCDPDQTVVLGQCQDPPPASGGGEGDTDSADGTTTGNAGSDSTTADTSSTGNGGEGNGGEGGLSSSSDTTDSGTTDTDTTDSGTTDTGIEPEAPNFGATCADHPDCKGGTVCGAPQLPMCLGLCGPGATFENSCPSGTACTPVDAQTSVCL